MGEVSEDEGHGCWPALRPPMKLLVANGFRPSSHKGHCTARASNQQPSRGCREAAVLFNSAVASADTGVLNHESWKICKGTAATRWNMGGWTHQQAPRPAL